MATRKGRSWFRIISGALMALVCLVLLYQFWLFAQVVWYNYRPPGSSAIMREERSRLSDGNPDFELKYEWVPYDKINRNLKRAVVASEDSNFTEHDGVEWDAIRKAWEYNQKQQEAGRSKMRGGSTITQQLAKNLLLSGERTLLRKGQEFVLTLALEQLLSKQRILEIYLNNVEWGEGVFGAEAAAQHYFRKSASRLSTAEAARLAVMLPAPKRFEKTPGSAYLAGRTRTILGRMGGAELP